MCDPFSIAAISTVGSLAATGYGMYQQNQAIQDQNAANQSWRDWQTKQRLLAQQKEEEMRRNADASRQGALDQLGAEDQKAAQTEEAARLTDYYTDGQQVNTATINDALLSGQQDGGQEFQTDIAKRIAKASTEARARIKALADVNSYGNSFNGLDTRNKEVLDTSGQGIDLYNNMRKGNLASYGIAQAVQPMELAPVTDYASGIGTALAGIAGKGWGNYLGGKV